MVVGVKMAEIFEKKKKTRKRPIESVKKIKILKIGLRSDLSWPKVVLEPKYHEPGTFGGFGKREQTNRQDSCFISIDVCIYFILFSYHGGWGFMGFVLKYHNSNCKNARLKKDTVFHLYMYKH